MTIQLEDAVGDAEFWKSIYTSWKNRADAAEAHSLLLREALQLLLANMLDHQGCPMPGHLISTCEKLAKAVLSTPIPDSVSRLTRLKPSQGDKTDG